MSKFELKPLFKGYDRQKCFIGYSQQAYWAKDLLAACHEVLSTPRFNLEIDYASKHFNPNITLRKKAVELIANSRFGIYDLSYWRQDSSSEWQLPNNVFIELGIAIGLNRPTLLLWNEKNTKVGLVFPQCLESIRDKVLVWSGTTTLKKALADRLPNWIGVSPSEGWYNRYCYFGGRVCEHREIHPGSYDWRTQVIECHISDGEDVDKVDFRGIVNEIIDRFEDISHKHIDDLSLADGYQFIICSYCQTIRRTPVAIYRITEDTSPETYISIGISIALETQSDQEVYRILIADTAQSIPSLLKGYGIIEAQNDKDRRSKLLEFIPQVKHKLRNIAWKPQPLPFFEIEVDDGLVPPGAKISHILVVDDEDESRERLAQIFRKQGWEAIQATTNAEALEALEKYDFSLVTTDSLRLINTYGEAGHVGLDLIREMQTLYPETPVLLASIDSPDYLYQQAPDILPWGIVNRQAKEEDILDIVRAVLDGKHLDTPWSKKKETEKHILISYNPRSGIAEEQARIVNDKLKENGFNTWVTFEKQWPGGNWEAVIEPVIKKSSHLISVYTKEQAQSNDFEYEINTATKLNIPIFVILPTMVELPLFLRDSTALVVNLEDKTDWYEVIQGKLVLANTSPNLRDTFVESRNIRVIDLANQLETSIAQILKNEGVIVNDEKLTQLWGQLQATDIDVPPGFTTTVNTIWQLRNSIAHGTLQGETEEREIGRILKSGQQVIDWLHNLATSSSNKDGYIFISHSTEDNEITSTLGEALTEEGFEVWIDFDDIASGQRWLLTIQKAIEDCAALVVVMSRSSRDSEWVERETLLAMDLMKPIHTVLINDLPLPLHLINRPVTDLRSSDPEAVKKLAQGLRKLNLSSKPRRTPKKLSPLPDQDNFFDYVAKLPDGKQNTLVAKDLYSWAKQHADSVEFGGKITPGFHVRVWIGDDAVTIFSVWAYPRSPAVQVQFAYLSDYPPYDDTNLRRSTLRSLGRLSDNPLIDDQVDRRPIFPLASTFDSAEKLDTFKQIAQEIIDNLRGV
jgi:CheY-like chemotaxis protein